MKNIVLILSICLCALALQAQPGPKKEKIMAQRVAFITSNLKLTTVEAEKFWPIYNELNKEIEKSKQHLMGMTREHDIDDISEAQANEIIVAMNKSEENRLRLKKEYTQKLRSAIPAKKIVKLYMLERKFKHKLVKEIRKRMKKRLFKNKKH